MSVDYPSIQAAIPEMDDFILVNSVHVIMRFNDEVQSQIRQFLALGKFAR
ncbi:MAG: hypothetical protein ACI9T9_002843 [Oleiphilaceae bacterium]